MHTPRLLIHIVGLKIEVLAAAQLCSKGGERRNVGMGLFPHHSVSVSSIQAGDQQQGGSVHASTTHRGAFSMLPLKSGKKCW